MKLALLILSSAALALAGPIIPTMVPDDPPTATSTNEPLPTPTEDFFEYPWPLAICAWGEPPSRYPHGCCDVSPGYCIPRFIDPPRHFELGPEETEVARAK